MEPYNVIFLGMWICTNFPLCILVIFCRLSYIYAKRENMREGYPLENEEGDLSANQGPYGGPSETKTFKLPQVGVALLFRKWKRKRNCLLRGKHCRWSTIFAYWKSYDGWHRRQLGLSEEMFLNWMDMVSPR